MNPDTGILLIAGVILVVILVILIVYFIVDASESNSGTSNQTTDTLRSRIPITFCEHSLATHHPGQVHHLLHCRRFRELNPNLSVQDYLKYEGFDKIVIISDWPDLDNVNKEE
jgi:hypothetical protein